MERWAQMNADAPPPVDPYRYGETYKGVFRSGIDAVIEALRDTTPMSGADARRLGRWTGSFLWLCVVPGLGLLAAPFLLRWARHIGRRRLAYGDVKPWAYKTSMVSLVSVMALLQAYGVLYFLHRLDIMFSWPIVATMVVGGIGGSYMDDKDGPFALSNRDEW